MAKTNFDYLKNIDKNLFEIVLEAERLYRGEFFEQCMGQTRRFGEHLCRSVLGSKRTNEVTFDEMLSTLKDTPNQSEQEKEFIDDLYFLKKQGNLSVHSGTVGKDATTALECLQRAFEAGLNYSVFHEKASSDILKLRYDTELLITGNPSKKSLSDKYLEAQEQAAKISKKKPVKKSQKPKPQVTSMNSVPRETGIPPFWIVVGVFFVIALFTIIYILV
ncbi:hypothetical protein IJ674_01075 [bacterium]|nr:hypothetical protein [bacterium]